MWQDSLEAVQSTLSYTSERKSITIKFKHLEMGFPRSGLYPHHVKMTSSLPGKWHLCIFSPWTLHCSPSDLEADDEDNQDYDSLTMSDSTLSLVQPASSAITSIHPSNSLQTTRPPANGRPATPTSESVDEVSYFNAFLSSVNCY